MVIAMYLLLFFLTIMLMKSYRKIITWCFSFYLTGIFLLLVAALLYMAKFSQYHFPLSIDYSIYLWMSKIKIRISDVSRIYNIGIAVIMLVPCVLFSALGKKNIIRSILLVIPIVAYLWYNDYNTSETIYILMHSTQKADTVKWLADLGRNTSIIAVLLYMLLPIPFFLNRIRESKYHYTKRENIVSLLCVTALDIFVSVFFIFGNLRTINPYYSTLLKHPTEDLIWDTYYLLPLSLMIVLIAIMVALYWVDPFRQIVFFDKKSIYKSSRRIDKSTRMIFHSYKNSYVTMAKLAECAETAADKDIKVCKEMIEKIKKLSLSSIEDISNMIVSLEEISISVRDISIRSCIEKACEKIAVPEYIILEKDYKVEDAVIQGSEEHIVSMIVNLINNAVEAIDESEREKGCICISVDTDEYYLEIAITDNGKGIQRSEIKNIYKSLFSTKSGCKNFGLGLTFVDKVVKAHFGHIHVKSKPGEETQFQILLPLKKINRKRGAAV
ncbi:MAG: HAMP domain-containing histidine kinase [Clostridia bacterium]|nr:HAMP domain-containing histidine kinase [Clostridia bacterium]